MRHFPVFLNVRNRAVLVVGSGAAAMHRTELMRRFGARVFAATEAPGLALEALLKQGTVTRLPEQPGAWADEAWALVFALADRPETNRLAYEFAVSRRIPVNVMDDPTLCTFIMPSLVERPPLLIAISTDGEAPALARALREWLESLIGPAYGRLAAWAGSMRREVRQRLPMFTARRRLWERVFRGPVARHVLSGDEVAADWAMAAELASSEVGQARGEVLLVGAGPGDPELLTLGALRALQRADVVVHDQLVSEGVLALARSGAERIDVGKRAGSHSCSQADIHSVLLEHVRAGSTVVRLKGGDPFIFGRGGEELQALMEAGVPVSVIPGVSAANGCAAYAGIPLTHRDCAHSVTFVTAHLRDGALPLDWAQLAKPKQTVVFFMGKAALRTIGAQLQAHGLPPHHPAAIVSEGTTPRQRVWRCTLESLAPLVEAEEIPSPALLIVGEVVNLARQMEAVRPDGTPAGLSVDGVAGSG